MAHDVFISYANQDKPIADAICGALEAERIPCWVAPRDIQPGRSWGGAIIDGITGSRIFILVFSSHSNRSPQVLREIESAVSKGLYIIPFRIEDVAPSKDLEYFVGTTHWLNALTPLCKKHLQLLAGAVRLQLSRLPVRPDLRPGEANRTENAEAARTVEPETADQAKSALKAKEHLNLGLALRANHDFDGAFREYHKALLIMPDCAEAHSALGYALGELGNWRDAIREYREALRLTPDDAEAHRSLGYALSKVGDWRGEIREYREALRLAPYDYSARHDLAEALLRVDDDMTQDTADAMVREALRLMPENAIGHSRLGSSLLARGNLEEAVVHLRQAVHLEPGDELSRKLLGLALDKRGGRNDPH